MRFRGQLLVLVTAAIGLLIAAACQRSGVQASREDARTLSSQKVLSMDDKDFLISALKSEIWQKSLAQTAIEKSANPDVHRFAQQLAEDRERALTELRTLMKAKGVSEPPDLSDEMRLEADNRLHHTSGSAFDDEFVSLITADQQETVRLFDSAANTLPDPDIRSYAARVLPSLRKDLDTAIGLERKIRKTSG
jgi:putative membrane protein